MITAIKIEYKLELSRISVNGFLFMFRKKQEELITESTCSMCMWLSKIKEGRIAHQDPNQIKDTFDKEGALQTSLELQEYIEEELKGLD